MIIRFYDRFWGNNGHRFARSVVQIQRRRDETGFTFRPLCGKVTPLELKRMKGRYRIFRPAN